MLRTAQRAVKPLQSHSRGLADLVVPPRSKPVIQYGPPGRSAVSGHVATVFGASSFLGRYLISKLAKAGTQVIVPYRDEYDVRHLKVMGDLGQIVPLEWDIRNPTTIEECLRHSDVVYNLVGRDWETKHFSYDDVNVKGARTIAEIAAANSVSNFIHVSHLNAAHDSPSVFYRTKAAGEDAVREVLPNATIVRPAQFYGHEDKLLNSMAFYPILWTLNHAATRIRPVHVLDVAQALSNLIALPSFPGANPSNSLTIDLPGPTVHSYASLLNLIASVTYRPGTRAPTIPKSAMLAVTKAAQYAWWPLLSPDEVERRYINDRGTAEGEETWTGDWDRFGIIPEEVENVAITYLRRFRSAANYTRPVLLPATRGTPDYHILD
ncbi:hypothetical protein FRC03_003834 [Tulasnella sp. 419]|nr:hypothetical protein FRC02_003550 [Tulasnella sp. 418]KAG8962739.1 hypothetical protein FRC03_003834 [Tulasnella sp. 419]